MLRRSLALLLLTGLLGVSVACGDDSSSDRSPNPDGTSANEAAFPVTIEHTYGSTTIDEEPERIVTVGFTDADMLLALDVVPVGLQRWYGEHEHGVWPWAEAHLGDAEPVVIEGESLNYEAIAELDPDLILGLYSGLEPDEYETLAAIAPTVAQSGEHPEFGTPWQEMTRTAGLAVGKAAEADGLVDEVSALFATARAEHPEFEGVELAYAGVFGEGQFYVETQGSTRVQILLDLGFVVPDELAALGDDAFYHEISAEQLSLLDQDVVLWEPADIAQLPAVEANPLYQRLAVATENREVFLDDPIIAAAMAHSSVLSLPVVLEALVPELAAAVSRLP